MPRTVSSTFFPGPTGFSLLAMQIQPGSTACRLGSIFSASADHTLFSRPRPQTPPVRAAPAPIPTVWTKLRRVSAMAPLLLPRRGCRRRLEHAAEHLGGLLHLLHRAERDARPLLFERREVAADHHALRGAALAEGRGRHRFAD